MQQVICDEVCDDDVAVIYYYTVHIYHCLIHTNTVYVFIYVTIRHIALLHTHIHTHTYKLIRDLCPNSMPPHPSLPPPI